MMLLKRVHDARLLVDDTRTCSQDANQEVQTGGRGDTAPQILGHIRHRLADTATLASNCYRKCCHHEKYPWVCVKMC